MRGVVRSFEIRILYGCASVENQWGATWGLFVLFSLFFGLGNNWVTIFWEVRSIELALGYIGGGSFLTSFDTYN